jgi:urease accessory protein
LFVLAALVVSHDAGAHHAMEYATPATALEGVLSGLAHPVIGVDHFPFIVGLGVACYYFAQPLPVVLAFLGAALLGSLLYLLQPGLLPYADAWVAARLLALGLLFLRTRTGPAPGIGTVAALLALAGVLHGYAYGEAVLGAEAAPVVAYLIGFPLVQVLVVALGYTIARHADRLQKRVGFMRTASLFLILPGAAFLVVALAA